MTTTRHFNRKFIFAATAFAALITLTAHAAFYNIGSGFSATNNPTATGLWRYGWSNALDSEFILYNQSGADGKLNTWSDAKLGFTPSVAANLTNQVQDGWPPNTVGLRPGADGQYSRVRFTAPETNLYYIALEFTALDPATTDVHVIRNNTLPSMFSAEVDNNIQEFFPQGMVLAQGDTIDFVVGCGSGGAKGGCDNDATAVFTTITKGCLADVTFNGSVDVDDLLAIINAWGPCKPKQPCPDLAPPSGNSEIDVDDLLVVINGWGSCN